MCLDCSGMVYFGGVLLNPVIAWMLAAAGFFALLFALLSWVTNGFILPFLRVKGSRDAKFIVLIFSTLRAYFRIGEKREGMIYFKKKGEKEPCRLAIPEGKRIFYRFLGVNWVAMDEDKNAIMTLDFVGVSGFDSEKFDGIIKRALYNPNLFEDKIKILLIVVIIIGILAIVNTALLAIVYKMVKQIALMTPQAANVIP